MEAAISQHQLAPPDAQRTAAASAARSELEAADSQHQPPSGRLSGDKTVRYLSVSGTVQRTNMQAPRSKLEAAISQRQSPSRRSPRVARVSTSLFRAVHHRLVFPARGDRPGFRIGRRRARKPQGERQIFGECSRKALTQREEREGSLGEEVGREEAFEASLRESLGGVSVGEEGDQDRDESGPCYRNAC